MTKELFELIALEIQEERRRRNNQLLQAVKGELEIYNLEDLMRLVGTLEAAYNHCLASIAGDGDIYCLLKHVAYAIILAGEVDGDVTSLYQIMASITGEKIQPCGACKGEEDESKDGTNLNNDKKEGKRILRQKRTKSHGARKAN